MDDLDFRDTACRRESAFKMTMMCLFILMSITCLQSIGYKFVPTKDIGSMSADDICFHLDGSLHLQVSKIIGMKLDG